MKTFKEFMVIAENVKYIDEMQYITPPQPSAIVRPAPSKINRTPSKINQKGREINQQSSKGSGMATQALVGLGAAGAVVASGKGEKRKYRM